MENIDITMTATIRPSIISKTLDSINNHIIGKKPRENFRLVLNIDQIGEPYKPKEVLRVVEEKFPNFIYNIADNPSFPKAVKWVWSQVNTKYIFHIEDDWTFPRKIDVLHMMNILDKYERLSSLRLSKFRTPNSPVFRMFECKWRFIEEGYYLADDWRRQFGLNPILIKRQFIDEALPRMVDHVNPEKQFRESQKYMVDVIKKWKYGMFTFPGSVALAMDIGRRWEGKKLYTKPKVGTFLTWVKK